MFCENCGKELADDTRFCPECGTEIRIPYPDQKKTKINNQDFEFAKNEKPFVSKQKMTTERKNIFASQASHLEYNYNFGHILAVIGAVLEIVSLFLPNKGKLFNGINMWELLKILLQSMLKSFSELGEEGNILICYSIIITYLVLLFISCIELNTDSLIITSIFNIAIVGYIVYQYNNFFISGMDILENTEVLNMEDLESIGKSLHDLKRVQGMGYWVFLGSGIMILVSAVIAKMLSVNEKSKASSKTF